MARLISKQEYEQKRAIVEEKEGQRRRQEEEENRRRNEEAAALAYIVKEATEYFNRICEVNPVGVFGADGVLDLFYTYEKHASVVSAVFRNAGWRSTWENKAGTCGYVVHVYRE